MYRGRVPYRARVNPRVSGSNSKDPCLQFSWKKSQHWDVNVQPNSDTHTLFQWPWKGENFGWPLNKNDLWSFRSAHNLPINPSLHSRKHGYTIFFSQQRIFVGFTFHHNGWAHPPLSVPTRTHFRFNERTAHSYACCREHLTVVRFTIEQGFPPCLKLEQIFVFLLFGKGGGGLSNQIKGKVRWVNQTRLKHETETCLLWF